MPYDLNSDPPWAECPCCKKNVGGLQKIEEAFGFRDMGDGRVISQSYCRDCRSARCEAGSPCKCL